MGGFLVLNDDALAVEIRDVLILTEGFPTYGGLAGRDLGALADGLDEVLDERYLEYRIAVDRTTSAEQHHGRLACRCSRPPAGTPSTSMRARFCRTSRPRSCPVRACRSRSIVKPGSAACEIGTVMFGHTLPDGTQAAQRRSTSCASRSRAASTRSPTSTTSSEVVLEVAKNAASLPGYRITSAPRVLRHFTARFEPLAT